MKPFVKINRVIMPDEDASFPAHGFVRVTNGGEHPVALPSAIARSDRLRGWHTTQLLEPGQAIDVDEAGWSRFLETIGDFRDGSRDVSDPTALAAGLDAVGPGRYQ